MELSLALRTFAYVPRKLWIPVGGFAPKSTKKCRFLALAASCVAGFQPRYKNGMLRGDLARPTAGPGWPGATANRVERGNL